MFSFCLEHFNPHILCASTNKTHTSSNVSSFSALWVLFDSSLSSKHQQWNKNTFSTEGDFNDCSKCSKYKRPLHPPSEPCDRCSSSLPQAQSTVVLIKLCAAFHASSPMVILCYSQCDGGCKPPRHPIRAFIITYRLILLNQTHLPKGWV